MKAATSCLLVAILASGMGRAAQDVTRNIDEVVKDTGWRETEIPVKETARATEIAARDGAHATKKAIKKTGLFIRDAADKAEDALNHAAQKKSRDSFE